MKKISCTLTVIMTILFTGPIISAAEIYPRISEQELKKQKEREVVLQPIFEKYNKKKVSSRNLTIDESMILLKYSNGVDSSGVGISGSKSLTRRAFENIATSEELLIELFLTSETGAGKAYALLGMRCLNETLYEEYTSRIDLEELVGVRIGCLGMGMTIGDILESDFDVECSVLKKMPVIDLETGKLIINGDFDSLTLY